MEFYLGLVQIVSVHTILGLSAYIILLTGQVTMAQAGLVSVGAFCSAMLTTMAGWNIFPAMFIGSLGTCVLAIVLGYPALRVKGMIFVIATLAFGEAVRLFWFNFKFQVEKNGEMIGPNEAEGFRMIRYFPENGWSTAEVTVFLAVFAVLVMAALWWIDQSRYGSVLRAVGEDELAAQSVGINLTVVKVSAFAVGGFVAGIAGALYAHYTTHIEQENFGVLMATFAIAYPLLGGLSNIFGTLIAVIFIQVVLTEMLRFLGDWRNLLYGLLILVAMNFRPRGLMDDHFSKRIANAIGWRKGASDA